MGPSRQWCGDRIVFNDGLSPAAGRVLGSPGKAREDEGVEEGGGKVAPVEG